MSTAMATVVRMSSPGSPIGLRIRAVREARGLKQNELAKEAGVGRQWLNQVENDEIPNPGLRNLSAVAKALGVSVDYLRSGAPDAGTIPVPIRPEDLADVERTLKRPPWLRRKLDQVADLFIEQVPNDDAADVGDEHRGER